MNYCEKLNLIRAVAQDSMWYAEPEGSDRRLAYNAITDLIRESAQLVTKEAPDVDQDPQEKKTRGRKKKNS